MNPNQTIEIQLADDDGNPVTIRNVFIEIRYFMGGHFRYAFDVGRTNENGSLRLTYATIDTVRRANAEANLMDYNTSLDDCDPRVQIVIPSEQKLKEYYEQAIRFYQIAPAWSKD
jgi:uncharacterized protein YccT (UPF0319 family)